MVSKWQEAKFMLDDIEPSNNCYSRVQNLIREGNNLNQSLKNCSEGLGNCTRAYNDEREKLEVIRKIIVNGYDGDYGDDRIDKIEEVLDGA